MRYALAAMLLVGVAVLSGCGGGGGGSMTLPNASTAVVTVTAAGSPINGTTVTLSTGMSNSTPPGPTGAIATQVTNSAGQAVFSNLPASGQLCVSAQIQGTVKDQCEQPFPASVALQF